ncbi:hypothetical protein G7Z17_g271 [Cylindrodendrum hubeiense]|uniref:Uncharacterized protein n=1 Tax=Cylindrodendrum hubeiense TaxID=595255 RepID=A0A9P5LMI7_9HYPO|nr:hypothetical protein G7Z17_g271 [Cylindrodendrum hubeiense]
MHHRTPVACFIATQTACRHGIDQLLAPVLMLARSDLSAPAIARRDLHPSGCEVPAAGVGRSNSHNVYSVIFLHASHFNYSTPSIVKLALKITLLDTIPELMTCPCSTIIPPNAAPHRSPTGAEMPRGD